MGPDPSEELPINKKIKKVEGGRPPSDERDAVHCFGVGEGGGISGGVSEGLGLDHTPHDLARPGLGQVVDEVDAGGYGQGSHGGPDVGLEGLRQIVGGVDVLLQDDEGDDRLALDLIRLAYDRRFGYRLVGY